METTDTSETLLLISHTQRRHIPEDCNLQCIHYKTRVKLSAKLSLRIFCDLIVSQHEDQMSLKSQYCKIVFNFIYIYLETRRNIKRHLFFCPVYKN